MKARVIAGAVCLLSALLLGCAGRAYIAHAADALDRSLTEALDAEGTQLQKKGEACVSLWRRVRPGLSVLVHHKQTQALDEGFCMLSGGARGDPAQTKQLLRSLKAQVRTLSFSDRPSWENVLRVRVRPVI